MCSPAARSRVKSLNAVICTSRHAKFEGNDHVGDVLPRAPVVNRLVDDRSGCALLVLLLGWHARTKSIASCVEGTSNKPSQAINKNSAWGVILSNLASGSETKTFSPSPLPSMGGRRFAIEVAECSGDAESAHDAAKGNEPTDGFNARDLVGAAMLIVGRQQDGFAPSTQ